MPEPSLSEILNVNADPERGTGEPAVVFDDRQFIQGIQRQAEFHAQNDMNKYIQLLQNKKDFYKQGADIAKEQVDPNDKVGLQKRMADVFNKIAQDPKALFGGADMDNLQAQLAGISADATKSKQKYDFNKSMTDHIITSPTFNTDENRAVIKQSEQTPLDEWQPFTLSQTPTFDINKLVKTFLGDANDPANPVYNKTDENVFTPDNTHYFNRSTETIKRDPVLKRARMALAVPETRRAIEGLYTPEVKKLYENKGGIEKFWDDYVTGVTGLDKDLTRVTDGNLIANNYKDNQAALAQQLKIAQMKDATDRYIAGLKDDKKTPIPKDLKPLDSLLAVTGALNKRVKVSELPINLVATLDPSFLDKDEKLTPAAKNVEISVGGDNNVYVYPDATKDKESRRINESSLLQNITSWAVTKAKELKGQDVLPDTEKAAAAARGRNAQNERGGGTKAGAMDDTQYEEFLRKNGLK